MKGKHDDSNMVIALDDGHDIPVEAIRAARECDVPWPFMEESQKGIDWTGTDIGKLHFAVVRAALQFVDYLRTKGHDEELNERFSAYSLLEHEVDCVLRFTGQVTPQR